MPIRAVLFDLDGTLVDSNDLHVRAWAEVLSAAGHPFDDAAIHRQIGKGSDMFVPSLLPDIGQEEREKLGEEHGRVFRGRYLDQVRPFPGARALLERVHTAGQSVVLASSAAGAELEHYLDLLDARTLVTATTSADDVAHTKPAPDIFAAALGKIAPIAADEAIVVGDTPYDVEAAAGCGLRTVAVRSGKFADDILREAGATAIYDGTAALLTDYDRSPLAA